MPLDAGAKTQTLSDMEEARPWPPDAGPQTPAVPQAPGAGPQPPRLPARSRGHTARRLGQSDGQVGAAAARCGIAGAIGIAGLQGPSAGQGCKLAVASAQASSKRRVRIIDLVIGEVGKSKR
jgi:hypothetical protein